VLHCVTESCVQIHCSQVCILLQNEIEDFKQKYIYPTIFTTEKSEKSYPCINLDSYLGQWKWILKEGCLVFFLLMNRYFLASVVEDHQVMVFLPIAQQWLLCQFL